MTVHEIRGASAPITQGRKLCGYAATFGQETRLDNFVEVIKPGAFSPSLQGRDILALIDHDPKQLLGRTSSGTLRLSEDERGLKYEIDLPDTNAGRDLLTLAERGDLGGMSFGFTVDKGGERWQGIKRELLAVTLHEISVVHSWPAYQGTSVEARGKTPKLNQARLFLETMEPRKTTRQHYKELLEVFNGLALQEEKRRTLFK